MKQTFAGDHRAFDPDTFVGTGGRFFRPVSAEFNGATTVIEYVAVPMAEMPQRYGHLVDEAEDKAALIEMFGGSW